MFPVMGLEGRGEGHGPDSTRKRPGGRALLAVRRGNYQLGAGVAPWAQEKEQASGRGS